MNTTVLVIMLAVMIAMPVALAQSDVEPESVPAEMDAEVSVETDTELQEETDTELPVETSIDSPIVINEVELNPPGEDGTDAYEWAEIYNPSDSPVDIGGWSMSAEAADITITVGPDVSLRPDQYLTLTTVEGRLLDVAESLSLRDGNGSLVDQTPLLTDVEDDVATWQRGAGAHDTDTEEDWDVGSATRGYANSFGPPAIKSSIELEVSTDKLSYGAGEQIDISGKIGGIDLETTSFFITPKIELVISGPNYERTMSFDADESQEFHTSISSRDFEREPVSYNIVARFAGSVASTSFVIIGPEYDPLGSGAGTEPGLFIFTDRRAYVPGDTVTILAKTDFVYDFEGLEFVINGPDGRVLSNGVLFPSDRSHSTVLSAIDAAVARDSQFGTSFFLNTISPMFGVYEIVGRYGDYAHSTAFELESDERGDIDVTVASDKPDYEIGETVALSGRVNRAWVGTFDIDIEHQQNTAVITSDIDARVTTFRIRDAVLTQPDGRFNYTFDIPNDPVRAGKYTVTVSESTLAGTTSFNVHDGIEPYDDRMFSISTDKKAYALGDRITFSGRISANEPHITESTILISLMPEDDPASIGLVDTTIPDNTGTYTLLNTIERTLFEPGTYTVTASYIHANIGSLLQDAENVGSYSVKRIHNTPIYTDSTTIDVVDPRNLGEAQFTAALDGDAYDFGDTVNISGIVRDTAQIPSLTIGILGPNGKTIEYQAAVMDDGAYSFDWEAPTVQTDINTGAHTATVSFDQASEVLTFTVGQELDSISANTPVILNIDKYVYQNTDTIEASGRVLVPSGTYNTVPDTVRITIASTDTPLYYIVEFNVFPDSAGAYAVSERLSEGKYPNGTYIAAAKYTNSSVSEVFHIGEIPRGIRADTAR